MWSITLRLNREHSSIFPSGDDTINGDYEDVCFPINACSQSNQMAILLPMVSLFWTRYVMWVGTVYGENGSEHNIFNLIFPILFFLVYFTMTDNNHCTEWWKVYPHWNPI